LSIERSLWGLTALQVGKIVRNADWKGWTRGDLDLLLGKLGVENPASARALLVNLNHVKRTGGDRYMVLGPHIVRTIDKDLILCGSRSPQTVDWINDKVPGGAVAEDMQCGLRRIKISEEAANSLTDVIGGAPTGILGLELLVSEEEQSDWGSRLAWFQPGGLNHYNPGQDDEVEVFDFSSMTFKMHEHRASGRGFANVAKMQPMSLFRVRKQYDQRGVLRKPPSGDSGNGALQATLESLDDLRRGRFMVCEANNRMPINLEDGDLLRPEFMMFPTEIERGLHLLHCRPPEEINGALGDELPEKCVRFIGVPDEVAQLVVSKIWGCVE